MTSSINSDANPTELSKLLLDYSARYESASVEIAEILKRKPRLWIAIREGVSSDKRADLEWEMSDDGSNETRLKIEMKALEKTMSAIRARLSISELEARNII